jgi:hypothetical protein
MVGKSMHSHRTSNMKSSLLKTNEDNKQSMLPEIKKSIQETVRVEINERKTTRVNK